ncbi:MAG: hypothetical protein AB1330_01830 [Bacillota bacterium]
MKKVYLLPVSWTVSTWMRVEASSLKEAVEIAYNCDKLPPGGEYLSDSFEVHEEEARVILSDGTEVSVEEGE